MIYLSDRRNVTMATGIILASQWIAKTGIRFLFHARRQSRSFSKADASYPPSAVTFLRKAFIYTFICNQLLKKWQENRQA